MRLVELFNITVPEMLQEAAKDRYAQMLPDATIAKFYTALELDPRLKDENFLTKELGLDKMDLLGWSPVWIRGGWKVEVDWAVTELKKSDRVTWYLRYVKMQLLREMLRIMGRQVLAVNHLINTYELDTPEREILIPAVHQLRERSQKLAANINRDLGKFSAKATEAAKELVQQAHDNSDEAYKAYQIADKELHDNPNTNTRSRRTNALRAFEAARSYLSVVESHSHGSDQEFMELTGSGGMTITGNKTTFEHYVGMPIRAIRDFNWGFVPLRMLTAIFGYEEKLWSEKQARNIPETHPSMTKAEKIIEFPDGKAWFNLHKSYCSAEGKAMGHCGNSYRSERPVEVLTFREPVTDAEGNPSWQVDLTFIWNHKTGLIEESKGFNNLKPNSKYHPYIVELLKQPWIKGLSQAGTHAPEENFGIEDLDDENKQEIMEENPQIAGAKLKEEFDKNYELRHDYNDGMAWYFGQTAEGWGKIGEGLSLGKAFQTKKGVDFIQPLVMISFANEDSTNPGIINSIATQDNTKPDMKYLPHILDGLRLDGPTHFGMSRNPNHLQLKDIPKEERKRLAKDKPSYINASTAEEIKEMGYKSIKDYEDGSKWVILSTGRLQEAKVLYIEPFVATDGQTYYTKRLLADIATRSKLLNAIKVGETYAEMMLPDDGETKQISEKPGRQYHGVIKDLLRTDAVATLKKDAGQYSFDINDLQTEEREALLDEKPSLGGLSWVIKKEGMGQGVVDAINSGISEAAGSFQVSLDGYDEKTESFKVNEYSLKDLVESAKGDLTSKLYDIFSGEGDHELFEYFDTPSPDDYEATSYLDALKNHDQEQYARLVQYAWDEVGLDDEDEEYDKGELLDNTSHLLTFINENGIDDIQQSFASAYRDGLETGAENDAFETYEKFIKNLQYEDVHDSRHGEEPPGTVYLKAIPHQYSYTDQYGETKDVVCWTCEEVMIQMYFGVEFFEKVFEMEWESDAEEMLDVGNWVVKGIDEPYNGWQGYDDDAAKDSFIEYHIAELL